MTTHRPGTTEPGTTELQLGIVHDRSANTPYTFLGPATYITHQGERPMSITWRLHHAMPAELFEEMKVAAG